MLGTLLSILILGAMISAVYALIAIGFTMIFGVGGVLNLAHGALIMIGAFAYLGLTSTGGMLSLPPMVGFVIAVAVSAGASYAMYAGLVQFIEENVVITFLATVVLALLATELVTFWFGTDPYQLVPLVAGSLHLENVGTRVRYMELLGFVISWIAIGLLWYYVTQTDEGRSILATSMSERGAQLTGVDLDFVKSRTWLIAGAFAGIAGVFLGSLLSTYPVMWLNPLAIAFIIVVIGGIGSIKGSVVAAYLIGYLETVTIQFLGSSFQGIFSLVVLVVVLLVLPQGLYGREFVHE
ncbi:MULTISPECIES: branched-chain amino acid ABC transporter permease [Natrialbaceae]|uniref:branched-chain amino acid ABC transporter permease n=1 Tax=Natrialbaceae TaxID=1644061 RepID=UPI00207D2224|nr:branched-chain amino acid ABC transporter permease [Natronococcus sp. CG52]